MHENTPKDIEKIERKAREDDREAKRAEYVVDDVNRTMNPQRQNNSEKSYDKR